MDIEQARKFGQMESRLDSLEQSMQDMKDTNRRMEAKLDTLVEKVANSAGGTSMLITLLTISGVLGGLITKMVEVFTK